MPPLPPFLYHFPPPSLTPLPNHTSKDPPASPSPYWFTGEIPLDPLIKSNILLMQGCYLIMPDSEPMRSRILQTRTGKTSRTPKPARATPFPAVSLQKAEEGAIEQSPDISAMSFHHCRAYYFWRNCESFTLRIDTRDIRDNTLISSRGGGVYVQHSLANRASSGAINLTDVAVSTLTQRA